MKIVGVEMNEREMTAVAADASFLWRSGANIESVIKFMRERGFSQPQSTEALERVTGFDAIKAHLAVIYSETWRDRFQQDLQLNQQLTDALIQLGRESADSTIIETDLDVSFDPDTILNSTIAT